MFRLRAIDRLTFFIERQLIKGAGYQLAIVAAAIGVVSLLGGILVYPVNPDTNLAENIWWAFLRLTDPGYLGDDEGGWRRVVSTWLTISGYVLFMGTLVAILTRWLIGAMTTLERGLTPVSARRHVVILELDNRTASMVRQLIHGERGQRHFELRHQLKSLLLVVLADDVDASVSQRLRVDAQLSGRRGRGLILRSGSAMQPEALHRVASLDAEVIILPRQAQSSSTVNADIETIKALMSLNTQAELLSRPLPPIVVEMGDGHRNAVARRAYPGPMTIVTSDKIIGRLLAHCLLSPGFSEIATELLDGEEGQGFFLQNCGTLSGRTLGEAGQYFSQAMVCGYLRADGSGKPLLRSEFNDTLAEDDHLLLLAPHMNATQASSQPHYKALSSPTSSAAHSVPARRRQILVLGWNEHLPILLDELAGHKHGQFEVTIISTIPIAEREARLADTDAQTSDNVTLSHRERDYTLEGAIRRLEPARYDNIILLYSDRLGSSEEADARVLLGLMLLEEVIPDDHRAPAILVELSDPANESFLERHRGDVLISPMVISHWLAQVAIEPQLNRVLEDLFSAEGRSISFRPAIDFGLKGAYRFEDMRHTVAERTNQVLLGVMYAERSDGPKLQLNPSNEQTINLQPNDRCVVLSLGT